MRLSHTDRVEQRVASVVHSLGRGCETGTAASQRVLDRARDEVALWSNARGDEQRAILRRGIDKAPLSAKQRQALLTVLMGQVAGYGEVLPSSSQLERHERLEAQCRERGVAYATRQLFTGGTMPDALRSACDKAKVGWGKLVPKGKLDDAAVLSDAAKRIASGFVPDVEIRDVSPEVGSGVFARSRLRAGTFLGEYTGSVHVLDPQEYRRLCHENAYVLDYGVRLAHAMAVVDGKSCGNHTRFINHSYRPNAAEGCLYLADGRHSFFVAHRDIAAGEQLTINYGPDYWSIRDEPVRL